MNIFHIEISNNDFQFNREWFTDTNLFFDVLMTAMKIDLPDEIHIHQPAYVHNQFLLGKIIFTIVRTDLVRDEQIKLISERVEMPGK